MRSMFRSQLILGLSLTAAACGTERSSPLEPGGISALTVSPPPPPPECLTTAEIRPPIPANGSGVFHLGSTIPVKVRVTDCHGNLVNGLTVSLGLMRLDPSGSVGVIVSSSEADESPYLRQAGNGQYLFNLSTKLSRIDDDNLLTPGSYQLTVSGDFTDVVVQISLR